MNIGIFGASTQSGRAFLADFIAQGHEVYGYCRPSDHGREFAEAVGKAGGIYLERPPNTNEEASRLLPLGASRVGHDVAQLVEHARVIVIAHPSHFHEETARTLRDAGVRALRTPLVLAPARTLAAPYLWQILEPGYPLVCFSTSPYSCKAPAPGRAYIKRRKRTWLASLEGRFRRADRPSLEALFPQAIFTRTPAATALGNIGAIFHPSPYLMNWDAIRQAEETGQPFSFYMQGIAQRPDVGRTLEAIDQTRLQLAEALGLEVYGLASRPREDEWAGLMARVRRAEQRAHHELDALRRARRHCLTAIHQDAVSAQHWLDHTYGVSRIVGESLSDAVGRTPTYQRLSVPQRRYIDEDVPTGLVPLEALADRLGIEHTAISDMLALYEHLTGSDPRPAGRNLDGWDTEYLVSYLKGASPRDRSA